MKKLVFLMLFFPLLSYGQEKKVNVKLKSGTTLNGVLKSIDPLDCVAIVIAGVETKIKMADIDMIIELTDDPSQNNAHVDKDDWRNMPFTENTITHNIMNVAFDTNGPMGNCLFPQNESGNTIYSGIVDSDFSAERIADLAKEFVNSIPKMYRADISEKLEGTTKVGCEVELKIGKRSMSVGIFGDDNIGTWEKPASTVKFNLMIEIRNKKYRYSLYTFTTDRYRIPGDGMDKGPSNMIHWQRVNSLQKEMDDARKSKKIEFQQMIDYENQLYQEEYNAVQDFLRGVESFAKIRDNF